MDEFQAPAPEPLPEAKRPGFWTRQFNTEPTIRKRVFNVIFGIIAPILALIFDPVVFKGGSCLAPSGLLGEYSMFVYAAIGPGTLWLLVWTIAGTRLSPLSAVFSGVFLIGVMFAGGIGLLILPLSLFGLTMIIGLLGFLPFGTAFIYLRTSYQALHVAREKSLSTPRIIASAACGMILILSLPVLAWQQTTQIISANTDAIADFSNQQDQAEAIERVKTLNRTCLGLCAPQIAAAFMSDSNESTRQITRLESAYFEITGHTTSLRVCSES
jgi:hypothetical protein